MNGKAKKTKTGWSHNRILFEVRERGTSLMQLARENGYARNTLHTSLYKRHPAAHAVIVRFLGVSRHDIWPHWYGPDDRLLPLNHAHPHKRGAAL